MTSDLASLIEECMPTGQTLQSSRNELYEMLSNASRRYVPADSDVSDDDSWSDLDDLLDGNELGDTALYKNKNHVDEKSVHSVNSRPIKLVIPISSSRRLSACGRAA